MKRLVLISLISVSVLNINGLPDLSGLKGLDASTLASITKIPDFSVKLTGIAKLNLPNLGTLLNGVSGPDLSSVMGSLTDLSKLGDVASLNLSAHAPSVVKLAQLNISTPDLVGVIKGANADNLSISNYLLKLPTDQFDQFVNGLKPPADKQDLLNQLKKAKAQMASDEEKLAKINEQIQSFDAGKYDPTPASDQAKLAKLKAELKTVEDTITVDTKPVPALKKKIADAQAQFDKLSKALQGDYGKEEDIINIIKVEVAYNLLSALSDEDTYKAAVTVELYGKQHSFEVDVKLKNIPDDAKAIAAKIKALI